MCVRHVTGAEPFHLQLLPLMPERAGDSIDQTHVSVQMLMRPTFNRQCVLVFAHSQIPLPVRVFEQIQVETIVT